MGVLHIAGFEIPVARGGSSEEHGELGGGGYSVTGKPLGGHLALTDSVQARTPMIQLARARAIESLCRANNGHVWHCDNSVYAKAGLAMTDTPTFQTGTKKFGTHAISLAAAAGDVSIATVNTLYTVAAWVHDGVSWEHQILRSDGAKWVDQVRNDSATLDIAVTASVFTLLDPAAGTYFFDDLVWLDFKIWDTWGEDWPTSRDFSDLPELEVWGDMLSGYRLEGARAKARLTQSGKAGFSGTRSLGAVVDLDIMGPERVEDI